MITRPIFRAELNAVEGGRTPACMARCVNALDEIGPWSAVTASSAPPRP
jgi:hypothetical protein